MLMPNPVSVPRFVCEEFWGNLEQSVCCREPYHWARVEKAGLRVRDCRKCLPAEFRQSRDGDRSHLGFPVLNGNGKFRYFRSRSHPKITQRVRCPNAKMYVRRVERICCYDEYCVVRHFIRGEIHEHISDYPLS